MKDEKLHFVMDDTNNRYDFDDLAAFEATLDRAAVLRARRWENTPRYRGRLFS